jgi:hypothetical protein
MLLDVTFNLILFNTENLRSMYPSRLLKIKTLCVSLILSNFWKYAADTKRPYALEWGALTLDSIYLE